MKKQIEVQLDEITITVSKLPIGRYAEVLKILKNVFADLKIGNMDGVDPSQLITRIPELVETALPQLIEILTIATPLKKEELETLGLSEITDVSLAVVEANNYKEVYDKIKKASARLTQQTPEKPEAEKIGSGGQ